MGLSKHNSVWLKLEFTGSVPRVRGGVGLGCMDTRNSKCPCLSFLSQSLPHSLSLSYLFLSLAADGFPPQGSQPGQRCLQAHIKSPLISERWPTKKFSGKTLIGWAWVTCLSLDQSLQKHGGNAMIGQAWVTCLALWSEGR